jgi:hypothetical protein
MPSSPLIQAFFDEPTNTVSYILTDPVTREAAIIDPALDYEPRSVHLGAKSAMAILGVAAQKRFKCELQSRRCDLCRRHDLHAGLRDGSGGFPGRRCSYALPLDPAFLELSAVNTTFHVPRL